VDEPRKTAVSLSTRLVTTRLVLRAPKVTDVPELRLVMRKNAEHLRPFSPAHPPGEDPGSLTGLSTMVARQRREWRHDRRFSFVMTMRDPEAPIIGRVSLNNIVRGAFLNADLGYWIDESFQKRGLMTEGVRAVLAFAFDELGLHRVQAAIMPHNLASLRVVEKLGFRREGEAAAYLRIAGKWEDHILFAILAGEKPAATP
jgi:ribosomal-protein-alanine N-acetyltransferase